MKEKFQKMGMKEFGVEMKSEKRGFYFVKVKRMKLMKMKESDK